MTSADLSLILRRLDEVGRKLDRVLEELQTLNTPTAIGYSARRGSRPRKDQETNVWRKATLTITTPLKKRSDLRSAERTEPNRPLSTALQTCPGRQWPGPFSVDGSGE